MDDGRAFHVRMMDVTRGRLPRRLIAIVTMCACLLVTLHDELARASQGHPLPAAGDVGRRSAEEAQRAHRPDAALAAG